jgi:hypothetical protein
MRSDYFDTMAADAAHPRDEVTALARRQLGLRTSMSSNGW